MGEEIKNLALKNKIFMLIYFLEQKLRCVYFKGGGALKFSELCIFEPGTIENIRKFLLFTELYDCSQRNLEHIDLKKN